VETRCAICRGDVEFEVDLPSQPGGRERVVAIGTSIRCESCMELICGSCASKSDPRCCASCMSCDACGADAGPTAIDVVKGTVNPFASDPFANRERLCRGCYRVRVQRVA
jgi:hypothetical protein